MLFKGKAILKKLDIILKYVIQDPLKIAVMRRSIMQRFKMQVRCDDCGKDISDINYPLMQDDKTDRLLALCPDCVKIRRGEKKDE
jgi:hypothetical protein